MSKDLGWFLTIALLACLFLSLIATDQWFAILEDEVTILNAAASPVADTVSAFTKGTGQHEHPPLSDLLLHAWISTGVSSRIGFRLPFIFLYVAGIATIAWAAADLGPGGVISAGIVCCLWPTGFHFGRLLGWYSLAFFLVALLTLVHVKLLRRPSMSWWLAWICVSLGLVYTNYAGWAVTACLAVDLVSQHREWVTRHLRLMVAGGLVLLLGSAPLWPAFSAELETISPGSGIATRMALLLYGLFASGISESVAPWFPLLAAPAIVAGVVLVGFMIRYTRGFGLRIFFYFLALALAMALTNKLGTKRLVFLCPWLLLAVVATLTSAAKRRYVVVTALAVIGGIGWFGIVTRQYYAAPHFIEPWSTLARKALLQAGSDGLIITSHPAFAFEAAAVLGLPPQASWPAESGNVRDGFSWMQAGSPLATRVMLLRTTVSPEWEAIMDSAQAILQTKCVFLQSERYMPDTGYELKRRFFPSAKQPKWRAELTHYMCAKP